MLIRSPLPGETEQVASKVLGVVFDVHTVLGPGFREPIYEEATCLRLGSLGLRFARQQAVSVKYREWQIPGQRIDLIVENCLILELKAVKRLEPIHHAVLLSYLKTTGMRLGLLVNFHVVSLRHGIRRVIL
jgi:GxxExxY protein